MPLLEWLDWRVVIARMKKNDVHRYGGRYFLALEKLRPWHHYSINQTLIADFSAVLYAVVKKVDAGILLRRCFETGCAGCSRLLRIKVNNGSRGAQLPLKLQPLLLLLSCFLFRFFLRCHSHLLTSS